MSLIAASLISQGVGVGTNILMNELRRKEEDKLRRKAMLNQAQQVTANRLTEDQNRFTDYEYQGNGFESFNFQAGGSLIGSSIPRKLTSTIMKIIKSEEANSGYNNKRSVDVFKSKAKKEVDYENNIKSSDNAFKKAAETIISTPSRVMTAMEEYSPIYNLPKGVSYKDLVMREAKNRKRTFADGGLLNIDDSDSVVVNEDGTTTGSHETGNDLSLANSQGEDVKVESGEVIKDGTYAISKRNPTPFNSFAQRYIKHKTTAQQLSAKAKSTPDRIQANLFNRQADGELFRAELIPVEQERFNATNNKPGYAGIPTNEMQAGGDFNNDGYTYSLGDVYNQEYGITNHLSYPDTFIQNPFIKGYYNYQKTGQIPVIGDRYNWKNNVVSNNTSNIESHSDKRSRQRLVLNQPEFTNAPLNTSEGFLNLSSDNPRFASSRQSNIPIEGNIVKMFGKTYSKPNKDITGTRGNPDLMYPIPDIPEDTGRYPISKIPSKGIQSPAYNTTFNIYPNPTKDRISYDSSMINGPTRADLPDSYYNGPGRAEFNQANTIMNTSTNSNKPGLNTKSNSNNKTNSVSLPSTRYKLKSNNFTNLDPSKPWLKNNVSGNSTSNNVNTSSTITNDTSYNMNKDIALSSIDNIGNLTLSAYDLLRKQTPLPATQLTSLPSRRRYNPYGRMGRVSQDINNAARAVDLSTSNSQVARAAKKDLFTAGQSAKNQMFTQVEDMNIAGDNRYNELVAGINAENTARLNAAEQFRYGVQENRVSNLLSGLSGNISNFGDDVSNAINNKRMYELELEKARILRNSYDKDINDRVDDYDRANGGSLKKKAKRATRKVRLSK